MGLTLHGLTPVGLAFAIIVLFAMLLGIAAATWHALLAPYLLRRRLANLAATHPDPEKATLDSPAPMLVNEKAADSPDLDYIDIITPHNSPTASSIDPTHSTVTDSMISSSLSKFAKGDGDLTRPPPIHSPERRIRLSTNASERDLPWWFF